MKSLLHAFLLLIILLGLPSMVGAQVIKHKVTPKVIDKEVRQRDIFNEIVTIENLAAHKITVFPSVNAVSVNEGGDIVDFTSPSMSNNKVTPTSWVEIKRSGVELLPGETLELPLTIRIHPEAVAGVYHVFVGFGWGTNILEAQEQVKNGIAPGIIVTLSVEQDKEEFLKLGNFLIDRFISSPYNEAVTYTLTNPGEAEVVPTGEIIISDSQGREVGAIAVNPEGAPLAPGAESTYRIAMPTDGLLGKYKALLSVDYGTEQIASVYDTAFFYVIPWQKLLLLFVAVLIVAILLTFVLHRLYGNHGDDDDDEHGASYLPLYIRQEVSSNKDHDINLKKT